MSSSKQQQQSETFNNPNEGIVTNNNPDKLDAKEVELHNKEQIAAKQGEREDFVMVKQIYTDPDVDPVNDEFNDAEKKRIAGFNMNSYQQELDKEKYAKIGYMVEQSKMLFYTVFRKVRIDVENGKVEWEQRDYKYHQLTNAEKQKIKKLEGAIKTLETKNRLWFSGVVNEALYNDMILREEPVDVTIETLKNELLLEKFCLYFKETNKDVLAECNYVDLRDLVEAAEYRENGVPFSRKLASYRTTSGSGTVKVNLKS